MIIQVRGTSGSGKSWVMRQVMGCLGEKEAIYVAGRKRPLCYSYPGVLILGHYETPCGGCDTIGSAKQVCELIRRLDSKAAQTILCEGLLLSEDVKWSSQLPDLKVLFLNTSPDTCLAQIEARRLEVGNGEPLNPRNTLRRVAVIERARLKLIEAGILCRRAAVRQAPQIILGWLTRRT